MEAVEPIERVGGQHVGDLAAAEIVDRGVPIGMKAPPRIGMFVKCGAIEAREAVLVGWEMRGHPVDDHAEAQPVSGDRRSAAKPWGAPKRLVGAKRPIGW